LLQPSALPHNLVVIPGPVYADAGAVQGALLGYQAQGPVHVVSNQPIPATINAVVEEKIVRTSPYSPYAPTVQSVPVVTQVPVHAHNRGVQFLQDELNDETVSLKSTLDL
jgi:hypothetical protein